MSLKAPDIRIGEFRSDRDLLDYSDTYIAKRMNMDKANYCRYVRGHLPITRYFIRRFYTAFGDEIVAIKSRTQKIDLNIAEKLNELTRRVDQLQKMYNELAEKC